MHRAWKSRVALPVLALALSAALLPPAPRSGLRVSVSAALSADPAGSSLTSGSKRQEGSDRGRPSGASRAATVGPSQPGASGKLPTATAEPKSIASTPGDGSPSTTGASSPSPTTGVPSPQPSTTSTSTSTTLAAPVTETPTFAPARGSGAARANIGFYPGEGDTPTAIAKFDALQGWLGRAVPFVVQMTDRTSVSATYSNLWSIAENPRGNWASYVGPKPTLVLSMAMGWGPFSPTTNAELAKVASGYYDDVYRYATAELKKANFPQVIVRLAWELDGNWMPWSATVDPATFIAAWQRVHDLMKAEMPSLRFDWTGTDGYQSAYQGWDAYWPGDDYVDIVGFDIYNFPGTTWAAQLQHLKGHLAFAAAHGKQVSFPEWALDTRTGDSEVWVANMLDWMDSLPAAAAGSLAYQSWFQGNPGGANGLHSLDQFPSSRAYFLRRLGA